MILLLLTVSLYSKLPSYAVKLAKGFNVPLDIATKWSLAESSHNVQRISHKNAYGRYQITKILLAHYFDLTGKNIESIRDVKKYLLDDFINCFIAYYMYHFWKKQGYNSRQIMQIWIHGETGYLSGRYAYKYEKRIFGSNLR
jgi:hypothetical protein